MSNQGLSFFREKIELLLLISEADVPPVVSDVIARRFIAAKQMNPDSDLSQMVLEAGRVPLILVKQDETESLSSLEQRIQMILAQFPNAFVMGILRDTSVEDSRKREFHERVFPISNVELNSTAKFEYLCLEKIRAQYYEIGLSDLFPMTTIPFAGYVRMKLNQRYLPVIHDGMVLEDEKFHKLSEFSKIYFHSQDVGRYADYVFNYYDTSGVGLRKRAKALIFKVSQQLLSLNSDLLQDCGRISRGRILQKYQELETTSLQVAELLQHNEDLWEGFKDSLQSELYSYWRAPWLGLYAALICRHNGKESIQTAMISGLLCDIGLLSLGQKDYLKLQLSGDTFLKDSEVFKSHPVTSLNRLLVHNIPISESMKAVIATSHENSFGTGFPNQTPAEMVPFEALAVLFAEKIDRGVKFDLSSSNISFRMLRERLWEKERADRNVFSEAFLSAIEKSLA